MRALPAAIITLVALGVFGGCGYDAGSDLPGIVEAVTPAGSRLITACGGSGGLIESPSHSCTFFARGDGSDVTAAVAEGLRGRGFAVACPAAGEITAVDEDVRVLVEVTQYGSVVGSDGVASVSDYGYRPRGSQVIPAGWVALRIAASRLVQASAASWRSRAREGGACHAALTKPNLAEYCVNWWNGLGGRKAAAEALRLRALPPVAVRAEWAIERSACTYTLRSSSGYLRVTARFDDGDWIWSPLEQVDRVPFRPVARLSDDGRLDLTG